MRRPAKSVLIPLVFSVGILLIPLGVLFIGSFSSQQLSIFPPYGLQNYSIALRETSFLPTVLNTLVFSSGAALFSLGISLVLAWYYGRFIFTGAGLLERLIFFSITIATFVQALGWIFIFNPNNGLLNKLFESFSGSSRPLLNIYSLTGMIFVQGLTDIPTSFAIMSASIAQFNRDLEYAGRVSGAGPLVVAVRIILPLLVPAIATSFLLSFTRAMESFVVPLFIGMPAGIPVLSTKVYFSIAAGVRPDFSLAAVYAIILTVPSIFLTIFSGSYLGSARYQFVRGQSVHSKARATGLFGLMGAMAVFIILATTVLVPLGIVFYVSIIKYIHIPGIETSSLLTLKGYQDILAGDLSIPLVNSFLYSIVAASIVVFLGLLLAYGTSRCGRRLSSFFGFSATVAYSVPGVVMGLAFIWTYIYTPLYGTMWIILLAYVTKYLPIGFRSILNGFSRIHDEIEEAALVYGGSLFRRIGSVLAPLLRRDILSGWMLVAAASFVDMSMTIFLFTSKTETVSVAVYNLYLEASTTDMAALALTASTVLMLIFTVLKRIFHVR